MIEEAFEHFQKAVELNPDNASAQGKSWQYTGAQERAPQRCARRFAKGVELDPESARGKMIWEFLSRMPEVWPRPLSIFRKPLRSHPDDADYRHNLSRVLAAQEKFVRRPHPMRESLPAFLHVQQPGILQMLAAMYSENGHYAEAITTVRHALERANEQQDGTWRPRSRRTS